MGRMRADLQPSSPSWLGGEAARLAIVLAIAVVAFSGSLGNAFVWDDLLFIRDNPVLEDPRNIPGFFVSGDAVGTYVVNPYYRPLVTASFAADTAIWGDAPAGFHATNLLLHLGVCSLLYFVARRLTAHPVAAFAAALLFAVHPAHAEPVAYVSARADLFCTFLALGAFLFHLRDLERESFLDRSLSLAMFLLALLSKITAGILPVLLAIHLALIAREGKRWHRLLPYFAITVGYLAIRSEIVEVGEWRDVPFSDRLVAAGPFLASYFRNALFPFGLKTFYDLPFRSSPLDPAVISAWLLVAGAIIGTVVLWLRRRKAAAFGLTWFLAALLPVSGIVITLYPAYIADRYLYFPLVGFAIAFGALVDVVAGAHSAGRIRAASGVAATICFLAMTSTSAGRVEEWSDSLRLWTAAAEDAPRSAYVLNNFGTELRNAGRLDEAEAALFRAISIEDRTASPYINLAGVALARRDIEKAERCVRRAMTLEPGNPVAMNFMGVIQANRGELAEAQRCFTEAVRIWPGYPEAIKNFRLLADLTFVGSGKVAAFD
jgi:tetratricopeptide (TPR) repeat protein